VSKEWEGDQWGSTITEQQFARKLSKHRSPTLLEMMFLRNCFDWSLIPTGHVIFWHEANELKVRCERGADVCSGV